MLQQNGVINGVLVWLGILSDDGRIQMVYNETGTLIAMTQILLPFMILPLVQRDESHSKKSYESSTKFRC